MMFLGKGALTVRERLDFNGDWRFIKEDVAGAQRNDFDDSDWRTLDLPHDWSIEGPFRADLASGTGYLPGGIGWYRKRFRLPDARDGRQVRVEFDGVYNHSEVWCNGVSLGKRPCGYASFGYDLTPHLKTGDAPNIIAATLTMTLFFLAAYAAARTGIGRVTLAFAPLPAAKLTGGVLVVLGAVMNIAARQVIGLQIARRFLRAFEVAKELDQPYRSLRASFISPYTSMSTILGERQARSFLGVRGVHAVCFPAPRILELVDFVVQAVESQGCSEARAWYFIAGYS